MLYIPEELLRRREQPRFLSRRDGHETVGASSPQHNNIIIIITTTTKTTRDEETAAAVVRGHRCWHDNSAMASSHGTTRSSFLFSTNRTRERERERERERDEERGALVGR
jgi:hypothetical protein